MTGGGRIRRSDRSAAGGSPRRRRSAPPRAETPADEAVWSIPPFAFAPASGTLRSAGRRRRLRPKAAALLRHLAEHAGEVVTQQELLAALWPEVNVGPGVLKVYVWEIRQALGDRRAAPRFIETVPGGGYRWIGPAPAAPGDDGDAAPSTLAGAPLVGRTAELAELGRRLRDALAGERQVVFLTGEAGIGKTALVEAFLQRAAAYPAVRVATGPCIEHYGSGEPYLPVRSALARLGRGPERRPLVAALRRHAPTWLAQLPSLRPRRLDRDASPPAPARSQAQMLLELAEALEAFTVRRALVLVIEDLHWSDASTLDLVSLLARRADRARLLLIGTYRQGEPSAAQPARATLEDLLARQPSAEIALRFLGEDDVAAYLRARFPALPQEASLDDLARAIHHRTEGNALFMASLADEILAAPRSGAALTLEEASERVRAVVPQSLRQTIERRVDRLGSDDQALLEAASAAGAEFSAAAVAAALAAPVSAVERRCARLARATRLLGAAGREEWPDGTVGARFGFVHSLYEQVLYDRLTPARRAEVHRAIGERLERGFGDRAGEIAAELGRHFEEARDDARAGRYLEMAAESALAKHANAEAARHFAKAIDILERSPPTPARDERELYLRARLGAPLVMLRGYGAPEVEAVYARALELSRCVGDGPALLMALVGVYRFSLVRSEIGTAKELATKAFQLAQRISLPIVSLAAHLMLGVSYFCLGELRRGRRHLEEALSLYDSEDHRSAAQSFGDDPAVVVHAELANVLWFLGHPDLALEHARTAVQCARAGGIPYSIAFALNYFVWSQLLRGEGVQAREHVDELLSIAVENGFEYWIAHGTAIRGWVLMEEGATAEGVAELQAGLEAYRAVGAEVVRPWHLGRLAEAHARLGDRGAARRALEEAFVSMGQNEERFYQAELHRLRGELLLGRLGVPLPESEPAAVPVRDRAEAEACFHRAIEIARRQSARSLELRAVTSLVRLEPDGAGAARARRRLRELCRGLAEGSETADLRAARACLGDTCGAEPAAPAAG